MIAVTRHILLDDDEIVEEFLRASGPGGQNVQKVETAVRLRFNLYASPNLPEDIKIRAAALAGRRLAANGDIVLLAQNFRSQERNRADALDRLVELIRAATVVPKRRRPTRPTKSAVAERLAGRFTVHALDTPGFGLSTPLPMPRPTASSR